MNKKIIAYYVELFHAQLDKNYVMQSKTFKSIDDAENFVKQINYVDDELGIDLMALYGEDEENYDIYKLGHFLETPIDGLALEITNEKLLLPTLTCMETPITGFKTKEDLKQYINNEIIKRFKNEPISFEYELYGNLITIKNIKWF